MFLKLQSQAFCRHKQGHHIMLVLKFGRINHMTTNLIFGHWVVFCTSLLLSILHLQPRIWKDCTIGYFKESILRFLRIIHLIWMLYWKVCCKLIRRRGLRVIRYYICLYFWVSIMNWSYRNRGNNQLMVAIKLICWGQLNCQVISSSSKESFLKAIMTIFHRMKKKRVVTITTKN